LQDLKLAALPKTENGMRYDGSNHTRVLLAAL
jgi:hypothetical protein